MTREDAIAILVAFAEENMRGYEDRGYDCTWCLSCGHPGVAHDPDCQLIAAIARVAEE